VGIFITSGSIHCPNCKYEGSARVRGAGCGTWLLWLGLFVVVMVLFWPLAIVVGPMFFWLLLSGKQTCKSCGNPHVVKLSEWRKRNK